MLYHLCFGMQQGGMECWHDACPAGREFTPLESLPQSSGAPGRTSSLHVLTRGSKFVRFQEVKLQELPTEVCESNARAFAPEMGQSDSD